jgi:hypothetical protein
MHPLQDVAAPEIGGLLRLLLLRFREMPADSAAAAALLLTTDSFQTFPHCLA